MEKTPFKRIGILYIPTSVWGWLITIGGVAYLVHVLLGINRTTSSISERIISYVINFIIVFAGYSVVGYFMTKKDGIDEEA